MLCARLRIWARSGTLKIKKINVIFDKYIFHEYHCNVNLYRQTCLCFDRVLNGVYVQLGCFTEMLFGTNINDT